MALFKICKDLEEVEKLPFKNGFAYFTPFDGKFYIDAEYEEKGELKKERININPNGKLSQKIIPIKEENEILIMGDEKKIKEVFYSE